MQEDDVVQKSWGRRVSRARLMELISDDNLNLCVNTGQLSVVNARAIHQLKQWLKAAEDALKPFAEEYKHWTAFPDDFTPIINDYESEEPDDADFTVGDLRQAAEILGMACVDEGCPYFGNPHSHRHATDG